MRTKKIRLSYWLAFLFAGLIGSLSLGRLTAEDLRPNVLFIAVDDLNDWIGCMQGHPQSRTPHMDRLAQRGVLFTNAHCAAPVCLASRTAVFSGRYPQQTGVFSNWGDGRGKAPPKAQQLTMQLSAAGYQTLGTGKLYHSSKTAMFDEFFDTEQRWSPFSQEQVEYTAEELKSKGSTRPKHLIHSGPGGRDWELPLNGLPSERNAEGNEGESFDWGPVEVADEEMGDTRITNWAISQLSQRKAKPFFLGVGYYRPHIPLFAPKRDFDLLPPTEQILLPQIDEHDLDDLGAEARKVALDAITAGTHELVVKHHQWRQAVQAYLACVTYVDRQIGRLVAALDESPVADNTWIVLWSDHGWQLGEKQHWGKWTSWRQSTRVPLIIVPPRGQTAVRGQSCAEPVSLVDLFPTLAEVCHLPVQDNLSGVSLVPLLSKPDQSTNRAVLTTVDEGNYALTISGWRYLRYRGGEEELYNTETDAHEWRNLASLPEYRTQLATMRKRLDQVLTSSTRATR